MNHSQTPYLDKVSSAMEVKKAEMPPPPADVQKQLNDLEYELGELQAVAETLSSRLLPVLRTEPLGNAGDTSGFSASTTLGTQIQQQAIRVYNARQLLADTLKRLEL